jgi:hypothetical protein
MLGLKNEREWAAFCDHVSHCGKPVWPLIESAKGLLALEQSPRRTGWNA